MINYVGCVLIIFSLTPTSKMSNVEENKKEIYFNSIDDLCKLVQDTDKEIRKLLEESKFLTLNVSTSALSHKNKENENKNKC